MTDNSPGLYKWTTIIENYGPQGDRYYPKEDTIIGAGGFCAWCGSSIITEYESKMFPFSHSAVPNVTEGQRLSQCLVCGWYYRTRTAYSHQVHINFQNTSEISALKYFEITDEENLSLCELATYLKNHFSDVYTISPRRFEALVEDIFKTLGYRTELTQQTRDKGADIIILNSSKGKQAIVEVKRYAQKHKIGVQLIRHLIGCQYLHQVDKSYLVTSSSFTSEANKTAELFKEISDGLEMELWDSARILDALKLYNASILPIKDIKRGVPLSEQIRKTEYEKRVIHW